MSAPSTERSTIRPALRNVRPCRQRRIERATQLGLIRPIRAERVDGLLQAEHGQVAEHMLPRLLRSPHNRSAITGYERLAGELLGIGEQRAPLRQEQVDHV